MKMAWNHKTAFKCFEKLNMSAVTPPLRTLEQKMGLKVADVRNKVKRLFEFCKEKIISVSSIKHCL